MKQIKKDQFLKITTVKPALNVTWIELNNIFSFIYSFCLY